ncbi:MAG: YfhO family protein [Ignavibacteriae bacterium]|nr:hypothetical protein [Ignavibacteriota bacterium]NOG97070.1 YfhO family protein [Ignavibacteriota bacterium]
MTKSKKKKVRESEKKREFNIDKYIPEKYQTISALGIILIVFLIYLSPMFFDGKTFESGDILTSKAAKSYVEKDRDGYTLWNPYIFCGMPAYAGALDYKWFNLIYVSVRVVRDAFTSIFSVDYTQWTFYLIVLAFTSFLLIKYLTKNFLVALFGGLATSLSTGIMLFLMIGHVTKLITLGFYPLIFLLLLKFEDKIKFRDFILLVIILQISIQGFHVQIIFYTLFSVFIYFLYNIIRSFYRKERDAVKRYLLSGVSFAIAFIIALAIQSDNLTQLYEYNPYSTRGSESVLDKSDNTNSGMSDSDFYQYATNWSFSPGEVLTFILPSYYGFGNVKYSGPLTQGQEVKVNTYFGQMPTVDMPMYMGVIIFFLGLFSIYANRKMPFVQFLTILIVVSILISFGRTFPLFYDLMFNYFPFFDKFRVPSMILVLVQLSFPVLAALGIFKIITVDTKKVEFEKILRYAAICFSLIFLLLLVFNSLFTDWFASRVNEYVSTVQSSNPRLAQQFNALNSFISKLFINDALFAFGFLSIVFWSIFAFLKNQIGAGVMVLIIISVTLIDLIRVNKRGEDYKEVVDTEMLFREPEYISAIKGQRDTDPYRVINIKQDGSFGSLNHNSNFNTYFLVQDFYGYSAIKPRSYQDFMDVLGPVNQSLWNMLNVKYVISDRDLNSPGFSLIEQTKNSFVFENLNSKPRFYFIDELQDLPGIDAIKSIGKPGFNPAEVGYVEKKIEIDKPDSTVYANIINYTDEKIELEVKASGNNLLFWGDTYYPVGWSAYLDGKETDIIKVNHGFNGIVVPEGEHNLKLIYLPTTFVITKYLVLVLSSLSILVLILSLVFEKRISFSKQKDNTGDIDNIEKN